MFYVGKNEELTVELLEKMISQYNIEVQPKLQRYKNYYDGIQDILNKTYSDSTKPNSRTVVNYVKNIVDCYAGYMATPSYISYSSDVDITDVMEVMRYNDYQTEDTDLLLNALIYGVACELMYIDNDGHTRFRMIDSQQGFGIYDNSLTNDLLYYVRIILANAPQTFLLYPMKNQSLTVSYHYKMLSMRLYQVRLMIIQPFVMLICYWLEQMPKTKRLRV